MPETRPAVPDAPLGFYDASGFRLATGATAGESLLASARYLFASETIAVPVTGPHAGYGRAVDPFEDLRAWSASPGAVTRPPLVWIAASQRRTGARIAVDGASFAAAGTTTPLALVPKIALNRSWADASTFAWLSRRFVTLRGEVPSDARFVARTIWPEDWRIDAGAPPVALTAEAAPYLAIRGLVRSAPRGGAASAPETHPLWEREPGRRDWAGRPVLALVLNGAQGDDDEAWGGHFALATGRLGDEGRVADLLVANFYVLDLESEKGTLPAPVPLDNYLADLNSGQAWYRPSYLMLAILADDRAVALVQGALNRLYQQFWRHQLKYRHSTMNCAAISVDTLRALGWRVPAREPADTLRAWLAVPAKVFTDGSIAGARTAYEYLTEDRTRLMPAAAFEETALGLLAFASRGAGPDDGTLAHQLAQDLVALVGLRLPQIPSSRALGTWPAADVDEYVRALPDDPADLRVVPVPPRPFPAALRDPDLFPEPARRSTLPLVVWSLTGVLPLAWLAGLAWRLLRRARR